MVRSLYTSADMEKHISITYDPMDRFQSVKVISGVVFQGQSNGLVKSIIQLYKSADIKKNFSFRTFWSTLMAKFILLGVIGICSIHFMQKFLFFGGSCI